MHVRPAATATPLLPLDPGAPTPLRARPPERTAAVSPAGAAALTGLPACVEDVAAAVLRGADGPPDPGGPAAPPVRLVRPV